MAPILNNGNLPNKTGKERVCEVKNRDWKMSTNFFCTKFLSGSHLRTPALKTENFSKKIGRFSKNAKMDLLKRSSPYFPGFSVQGMVLVNPFFAFY